MFSRCGLDPTMCIILFLLLIMVLCSCANRDNGCGTVTL